MLRVRRRLEIIQRYCVITGDSTFLHILVSKQISSRPGHNLTTNINNQSVLSQIGMGIIYHEEICRPALAQARVLSRSV